MCRGVCIRVKVVKLTLQADRNCFRLRETSDEANLVVDIIQTDAGELLGFRLIQGLHRQRLVHENVILVILDGLVIVGDLTFLLTAELDRAQLRF